ncbi:hypothetical protein SCHPADRAFT_826813 [Schizopora paradoxa]|uniref:Large ribosomal subunit protein mL49 n=1 Tax=Schizopora paradoxa TaxID=27342 RepID=A0A0H2RXJ5_9AGAM|nr:hypothetical protein SCHPADRAFT_826813 [Schizopora paradoxa]
MANLIRSRLLAISSSSSRIFPAFASRSVSSAQLDAPLNSLSVPNPSPRPHLDGKPAPNAKPHNITTAPSDGPTKASATSLPYSVARNSQGSLPVYSDIRNGGSRYLVLVRNVKGNVNALRDDLIASLFQPGSPEAARLKVAIPRSDTLVLTGGRWKHRILDWLRLKGF